jgi:hypothetical protein
MTASPARIEANRRNSARSTGPTSDSGKQKSRSNSLKHGLCADVVGVEDPEAVRERAEAVAGELAADLIPGDWLVNQVASLGLRVEHAQSLLEAARERMALRAGLAWEIDRKFEATLLGGEIHKRPDQTVERLRQTPQGCEWLMSRWAMLAHAAESNGGWTDEQSSLALDLLGTPREFREGAEPGTQIGLDGRSIGPVADRAAVARREIDELNERLGQLLELDAVDRKLAESGLADGAELRRLRRYEKELHRRLQWTLELLQGVPRPQQPSPTDPGPETEPKADAPPEATEEAPADAVAEVAPVGKASNRPRRSTSRAENKLIKDEARREARLRKLGKLRA